jgi:CO dehydrogenase maturation factor
LLSSVNFTDNTVIADLEAGLGTLTRLGEAQVDVVLLVVEATAKSLEVAARAADLAREKSLGRLIVIANRVRDDVDAEAVRKAFPDDEVVAVPHDPAIVEADRHGVAPLDSAPDAPAVRAITAMAQNLLVTASHNGSRS